LRGYREMKTVGCVEIPGNGRHQRSTKARVVTRPRSRHPAAFKQLLGTLPVGFVRVIGKHTVRVFAPAFHVLFVGELGATAHSALRGELFDFARAMCPANVPP